MARACNPVRQTRPDLPSRSALASGDTLSPSPRHRSPSHFAASASIGALGEAVGQCVYEVAQGGRVLNDERTIQSRECRRNPLQPFGSQLNVHPVAVLTCRMRNVGGNSVARARLVRNLSQGGDSGGKVFANVLDAIADPQRHCVGPGVFSSLVTTAPAASNPAGISNEPGCTAIAVIRSSRKVRTSPLAESAPVTYHRPE